MLYTDFSQIRIIMENVLRYLDFTDDLVKLKRVLWNKGILLWWYRLWIRKNEFHRSLDMDLLAMLVMDEKEVAEYELDLTQRRNIAHERSAEKSDKKKPGI